MDESKHVEKRNARVDGQGAHACRIKCGEGTRGLCRTCNDGAGKRHQMLWIEEKCREKEVDFKKDVIYICTMGI